MKTKIIRISLSIKKDVHKLKRMVELELENTNTMNHLFTLENMQKKQE